MWSSSQVLINQSDRLSQANYSERSASKPKVVGHHESSKLPPGAPLIEHPRGDNHKTAYKATARCEPLLG